MMKHIILFGPPGSGKGTQAKILSDKINFRHLSTGELFRFYMKINSSLGRQVQDYINKGVLVPDDLTTSMLQESLYNSVTCPGIIYDGYPRNLEQARSFDKILELLLLGSINITFCFRVSDDVLIERLYRRGKTSFRSDDSNLLVIKQRLSEYYKYTAPVSEFYRKKGILVEIDAEGSMEEITILISNQLQTL